MKRNVLNIVLLFIVSFSAIAANPKAGLTQEQTLEMNGVINEIRGKGLKPTDSNIFNICYSSSLLLVNASKDAVSGTYDGDRVIGEVLLIRHEEYREMVKELVRSDAVFNINKNPDDFERVFQMKCRANPETYIKKYKQIFRRQLTESDKKNQW